MFPKLHTTRLPSCLDFSFIFDSAGLVTACSWLVSQIVPRSKNRSTHYNYTKRPKPSIYPSRRSFVANQTVRCSSVYRRPSPLSSPFIGSGPLSQGIDRCLPRYASSKSCREVGGQSRNPHLHWWHELIDFSRPDDCLELYPGVNNLYLYQGSGKDGRMQWLLK